MLESPVLIMATNGHKRNATDAASAAVAKAANTAGVVSAAAAVVAVAAAAAVASAATNTNVDNTINDHFDSETFPITNDRREKSDFVMEADRENQVPNDQECMKPEVKGNQQDVDSKVENASASKIDYYNVKFCPPKQTPGMALEGMKTYFNHNHQKSSKKSNIQTGSDSQPTSSKDKNQNGDLRSNNKNPYQAKIYTNGETKFNRNFRKNLSTYNDGIKQTNHDNDNGNAFNDDNETKFNKQENKKNRKYNHKNSKHTLLNKIKDIEQKIERNSINPKKRIFYSQMSNDEVLAVMKNGSQKETATTITEEEEPRQQQNKASTSKMIENINAITVSTEDLDVINGGITISLPILPKQTNDLSVKCCLVSHPGHFYVRFDNNELSTLNDSMNAFYGEDDDGHIELSIDCIKSGKYYAASRDGKLWIRVQILQVQNSDIIHCSLIDNAGVEVFKVSQLQPLYNRFRATPKQAVRCELYRVKPKLGDDWPVDDAMKFKEIFSDKKFLISNETVIDQTQYEEKLSISVHDMLICDDNDKSIVELLIQKDLASLRD